MAMIERVSIGSVVLMLALATGVSAQETHAPQAPAADHAADAHSPAAVHIAAGEPVIVAMGCVMEGHGDHHGIVLAQVQRGSAMLSGVTTGEAGKWTHAREEEISAAHPLTNSYGMLFNTEYVLEPGTVDLQPLLDQQVRLTAVIRGGEGGTSLVPLQVSPIGALCAGGH